MPFTLAHPAAVLPLRRVGLPVSALVAGSMAPDLPLFVPRGPDYALTHSWLGVLTVDPLVTLLALSLWYAVLRDALVDLGPGPVRARLAPRVRPGTRSWLLVPVAGALGAGTHVVWDAFTHQGRWGVQLVPALARTWGPLPGWSWAQYASGAIGLAVLFLAAARHLHAQPVRPRPRRSSDRVAGLAAAVLATAAVACAGAALRRAAYGLQAVAYTGAVDAVLVLGAATVACCALWRLLVPPA